MTQLFYTPKNAKTGDVIPFYNERTGRFENYYLKNWNPDAPADQVIRGWHRISYQGNTVCEETPVHIDGGTGSVLYHDGVYHMFYCTFEQNPQLQWIRHATSSDLVHWEECKGEEFCADGEIYLKSDWRDPFVFWNEDEKCFFMLVAARENSVTHRNGCVGLCTSTDLSHWTYRKPLYSPHRRQSAYECPDLFRMGDWYYLVFSCYTDGFATYYRMSKSLKGPWIRPEVDTFDSRAFYAAKTGSDGINRYLFGWNPTRGENGFKFDPENDYGYDYKSFNWGGSIVMHQLVQHPDGTLGVKPTQELENAFDHSSPDALTPLTGRWSRDGNDGNDVSCPVQGEYCAAIGTEDIPDVCCIKASLSFEGKPEAFGIALNVDDGFDFGYYLMFEPDRRRIEYRSGLRMYEQGGCMFPYAVEMERPFTMTAGEPIDIEIYIQGTLGLLYVNKDTAFGFRMYNHRNRRIGAFSTEGGLRVRGLRVLTDN